MMRSSIMFMFALFVSPGILASHGHGRMTRHVGENGARFSSSFRTTEYTRATKQYIVEHAVRWNVIITPSLPIKYNGINYYWYGSYSYDASHPLKCEYPIDLGLDRELENITFSDGSKPPSIQYGCLTYEDCCGLECCGDSRSSTFIICGVLCVVLGIYTIVNKCSKTRKEDLSEEEIPVRPKQKPTVGARSV